MNKWSNEERYRKQTEIVQGALASDDHSLDSLLNAMRQGDEAALYLCGSRLDNDFCFGSKDVALLMTVLPEDGSKAAEPGYHPGSTEVYVTFQGSLIIEYIDDGNLHTRNVGQFDVVVLPPGQCHRIRPEPGREAASMVVKTNVNHKPGVVRCQDCWYFQDENDCPLYRSWQADAM